MRNSTLRAYSDASVRNGKSGLGYCLKTWQDKQIALIDSGSKTLNNEIGSFQAEYEAMLYALEIAHDLDYGNIILHTDAKAIADGIRHGYDGGVHDSYVKNAQHYLSQYNNWKIFKVHRATNDIAHTKSRLASSDPIQNNE